MSILVINAGSTSLKFGLFDATTCEPLAAGNIEWPDGNRDQATLTIRSNKTGSRQSRVSVPEDRAAALCAIEQVAREQAITLIGHRVVHGGTSGQGHCLIDARVEAMIEGLASLAPLHNPPALAGIRAARAVLPTVPQVAVFDTAFFAQLPPPAFLFPVPYEWYERWEIRRIGFHGISNAYCAQRAAELLPPKASGLRLITCHLGGGCSATAVRNGAPVITTMGFSPLDGLMMGTRPGSLDPGILLHLQRQHHITRDEIDEALNYRSGLLGLSGVSADLAQIEAAAQAGNERAGWAFSIFADRVRSAIGALAVAMDGLEALIFTDRIGENSPALRAAVCQGLGCLGVRLDQACNAACHPDADIASPGSAVRILVIHTQEELMIAREALAVAHGQRRGHEQGMER